VAEPPPRPVYPVVFIDAINVKIRDGQVANRPIYVAMAVTVDGHRDILGIWAGDGGEGAKHWLHVLTELKNRGVHDVLMLVCDGLKGLPDAVATVWPRTIVQTSSVHNGRAEIVSMVTRTVPGRTCADASPSRSRCRPVRPGRRRASHLRAGAALRAPR
jgi:transposase-like protein